MSEAAENLPVVLVFHKLLDGLTFGVTNYSPRRFERLLLLLQASAWQSVALSGDQAPEQGRGFIVSFDDGYRHLVDVLPPLMEKYSFQPVVFMPTALLGKTNHWDYSHCLRNTPHLSRENVRHLTGMGVVFGSHGASHLDLTSCAPSELKRELADSRKTLQDLTGQPVDYISYPFGRCNRRVIEETQEAGFRRGFTMRLPHANDQPLSLGRVPVYSYDTLWSVGRKLEAGTLHKLERFKTDTVNRLAGGTILLNRLRRSYF